MTINSLNHQVYSFKIYLKQCWDTQIIMELKVYMPLVQNKTNSNHFIERTFCHNNHRLTHSKQVHVIMFTPML